MRAALGDADGVGPVDLFGVEIAPDVGDAPDRIIKVVRAAGERRRIDGSGGGAGENLERVVLAR